MKFSDLIKSHDWLSVESTLTNLYPDQEENIDAYKRVFESLQIMQPINDKMLIVLTEQECDTNDESKIKSTYVDVSGRKQKQDPDSVTDYYAIEFTRWENWLGMELAPETINNFNEIEIIAHCLFEMTFMGFEQEEIQEEIDSINKTADEYESLTDEEKEQRSMSLDDLKKQFGNIVKNVRGDETENDN